MELIQAIKLKFKPSYEVESERFYSEFLNQEDAQNLRPFVLDFGGRLSVPSAILAVGSSVFPSSHWKYRRKLNVNNPDLNASETYNDIDLLIVPEEVVALNQLESAVQKALTQMNFPSKAHETTTSGVVYCDAYACGEDGKSERIVSPFLHLDYGLHSIETNLKNGTKLDLILGRDDLLEKTASQKIAEEKNGKYTFSLLYRK